MVDLERQTSTKSGKSLAKSTIMSNGEKRQKGSRRVAFSDIMPYDNQESDSQLSSQFTPQKCARKTKRGCFGCCAWSCFVTFAILIVLLIVALIFLSILKHSLPEVRIERVAISRLNLVSNSTKTETTVFSLDVEFRLNFTNTNNKVEVSYTGLSGKVTSDDNVLAQKKIDHGFSQKPKSMTSFKAVLDSQKATVPMEDGGTLKSRVKDNAMVLNVYLNGYVGYLVGGINLNGLPFAVKCLDVTQAQVHYAVDPKCSVQLFGV